MRPYKRLVACHIVPYSFTGRLHGRLPYCVVAQFVSFRGRLCKRLVTCSYSMYIQSGRLHGRPIHYVEFLFLCISGGHASDWSLAASSNALVLVACMVACVESGIHWKSHPGRVRYSFIKQPEQAPGRLLYF